MLHYIKYIIHLYPNLAAPQVIKSQSLIPFPRVGRSRSTVMQPIGGGGSSEEMGFNYNRPTNMMVNWRPYPRERDGNGHAIKDNIKKVIRWNNKNNNVDLREFKRHLIPFPRVGKRQSLIPFPRVGRSRFFPNEDDEESVALSAEDSPLISNDIAGILYSPFKLN